MKTGSCECGQVVYELHGDLRPVVACHCSQCRKTSGHFWAATSVADAGFKVVKDAGLKWFRSSESARRGFCVECGSSLFWQKDGEGRTSVGAGTIDGPTGLATSKHICVADKADYYQIEAGPLQADQFDVNEADRQQISSPDTTTTNSKE